MRAYLVRDKFGDLAEIRFALRPPAALDGISIAETDPSEALMHLCGAELEAIGKRRDAEIERADA